MLLLDRMPYEEKVVLKTTFWDAGMEGAGLTHTIIVSGLVFFFAMPTESQMWHIKSNTMCNCTMHCGMYHRAYRSPQLIWVLVHENSNDGRLLSRLTAHISIGLFWSYWPSILEEDEYGVVDATLIDINKAGINTNTEVLLAIDWT